MFLQRSNWNPGWSKTGPNKKLVSQPEDKNLKTNHGYLKNVNIVTGLLFTPVVITNSDKNVRQANLVTKNQFTLSHQRPS